MEGGREKQQKRGLLTGWWFSPWRYYSTVISYPDFGCGAEGSVARRLHELPLLLLSLGAHQHVEVGGQVTSQQGLLRGDVQQHCQGI